MEKVSIIMPIYNIVDYLPRAFRSAVEQTEQDIEIILVDDGSTDGSGVLCDRLAETDSRVRVIHKANGGLSSARNAGIAASGGKYVLLLDGDDRLHREAVARTLAVMEETGADFVQFCYREVAPEEELPASSAGGTYVMGEGPAQLFTNLYRLGGAGASACTKLFRRELLERIPYEPMRHEDEMWCTRAFAHPLRAAYIEDVLYDYVIRPGSIIHSGFSRSRLDAFQVCEERIRSLRELGLTELLSREYEKLYLYILRLYRDAREVGDREALSVVERSFKEYQAEIRSYARLRPKFALMFRMMCIHFKTAELYRIYWKIKT